MNTVPDFTMLELLLLYHHDLTVKFCVSELFMNKTQVPYKGGVQTFEKKKTS